MDFEKIDYPLPQPARTSPEAPLTDEDVAFRLQCSACAHRHPCSAYFNRRHDCVGGYEFKGEQ